MRREQSVRLRTARQGAADDSETVSGRRPKLQQIKVFWHSVVPHLFPLRHLLVGGVLVVATASLLQTLGPLALKEAINQLASKDVWAAAIATLTYVGIGWGVRLAQAGQFQCFGTVWRPLQKAIYLNAYGHLLDLPHSFYVHRRTGEITRLIADGVAGVRSIYLAILFRIFPAALQFAMILVILIIMKQIWLALFFLFFSIAYGWAFRRKIQRERHIQRAAIEADRRMAGIATDVLLNQEPIRLFDGRDFALSRIELASERCKILWTRYFKSQFWDRLLMSSIVMFAALSILLMAVWESVYSDMTPGGFVVVNMYLFQMMTPIENLGLAYQEATQGLAHVSDLWEILKERVEDREGAGNCALAEDVPVEVSIQDICFSYRPEHAVLRGITMRVGAGQTIAVVGPTGSGKSTLARLVARLYKPTSGRIQINGVDIEEVDLRSLRRAIGFVPQDPILFNESISDNIGLGCAGASRQQIVEAAMLAGLGDTLAALPAGLDTLVGERGVRLSGGEKQRIAIARAIIRKPRLFIFDEATSALDTATERLIHERLSHVSKGITTFVIAHRLSTIRSADEIIVMERGQIVERGRHQALLDVGGLYAAMWFAQLHEVGDEAGKPPSVVASSNASESALAPQPKGSLITPMIPTNS